MTKRNVIIWAHVNFPGNAPKKLILDRGTEFCSSDIERLCAKVGIVIQFDPMLAQTPLVRSQTEAIFRTLNRLRLIERNEVGK